MKLPTLAEILRRLRNPKSIAGFVLILLALGLFAWCRWPLPTDHESLAFSPQNLENLQPGIVIPDFMHDEKRYLVLDYPTKIRQGDVGWIKLAWQVEQNSVEINPENNAVTNVLVETRLDLLGIIQKPADSIEAPLIAGKTVLMQWQIFPSQAGVYSGSIWSYLNLSPGSSSTTDSQPADSFLPVAVQDVQIDVISLLGMGTNQVTWIAAISLVIAFVMLIWGFRPKSKKIVRRKRQK